jgi:hypothetical protein
MALKNNEEALLERIRRATAKELKRLRRQQSKAVRDGHARSARLQHDAETMSADASGTQISKDARTRLPLPMGTRHS